MAIGQWAPPAADENTIPWLLAKTPPGGGGNRHLVTVSPPEVGGNRRPGEGGGGDGHGGGEVVEQGQYSVIIEVWYFVHDPSRQTPKRGQLVPRASTSTPPPFCPNTGFSKHGDPAFPHFGLFWGPSFLRFQSSRECSLYLWGSLKRSARAVQLFGRLAVLETHTLRY